MKTSKLETSAPPADRLVSLGATGGAVSAKRRLVGFGLFAAVLSLIFVLPLLHLVQFGLAKERNSYLLLVPFISVYLIWIKRAEIVPSFKTSLGPALVPCAVGATCLVMTILGGSASPENTGHLTLQVIGLLFFLLAGSFVFIGADVLRQIIFPVTFLIFAAPVPDSVVDAVEIFLQHASAEAAYWMLSLSQVPFLREGLLFQLPGISIRVAQECSGYNSSFSLLIVSTLAGHLFLKSPVRKLVLMVFIVPLAIARNGFRITTLSLLCVYDDPSWIDSALHHRGGPIFFVLSLVPFSILLWWLRKSEIATCQTLKIGSTK